MDLNYKLFSQIHNDLICVKGHRSQNNPLQQIKGQTTIQQFHLLSSCLRIHYFLLVPRFSYYLTKRNKKIPLRGLTEINSDAKKQCI
jgi:hypothetical protein